MAQEKVFRAGAAIIDVTPTKLPVIVNGGMAERLAHKVVDPLHARCLVLDDGRTQVAIAVVDSCLIPRALLDKAKESVDNLLSKTVKKTPVPKTESQKSYGSESGSITPYQSFAPVEEGMSMKIKIMIGGVALLVIGGIAFAINKKRG